MGSPMLRRPVPLVGFIRPRTSPWSESPAPTLASTCPARARRGQGDSALRRRGAKLDCCWQRGGVCRSSLGVSQFNPLLVFTGDPQGSKPFGKGTSLKSTHLQKDICSVIPPFTGENRVVDWKARNPNGLGGKAAVVSRWGNPKRPLQPPPNWGTLTRHG